MQKLKNNINDGRFSDLPSELFFVIMSFLDHRELVDFMSVNRNFRMWAFQYLLSHFHNTPSISSFTDDFTCCFKYNSEIFDRLFSEMKHRGYYAFGNDGSFFNNSNPNLLSSQNYQCDNRNIDFSFSNTYLISRINEILSEGVFMSTLNLTRFKKLTNLIMSNSSSNIINRLVDECGLRSIYLDFIDEKNPLEWNDWRKYFSVESLNNLHVFHMTGPVGNPDEVLAHLINCKILSLSQNNLFYMNSLQNLTKMKKLTHLCLNNIEKNSFIENNILYMIFSNLTELQDLQVLEIICEVPLKLKIDEKVKQSAISTKIKHLTLITPSITLEGNLFHSTKLFTNLQVCQYLFVPIDSNNLLGFFIPTVDQLQLVLVSSSFSLELFLNIKIETLYIWKDRSFETIDFNCSKLFIGSRFKDEKIVNITKTSSTLPSIKISNTKFSFATLQKFNNLRSLIIDGSSHLYIDNLLHALSSSQELLTTLIFSRCEFYNSIVTSTKSLNFTNLKEFRLCSVHPVDFLLENVRFKAPSLEILEITDLYNTESQTIINFISESLIPLDLLKEFKIKEVQLGDKYLCEIYQKTLSSPNLNEVEIYTIGKITIDGLYSLLEIPYISKITSLNLPRFEVKQSQLEEYFYFIHKLHNLKVLTINIESIDILVSVFENICNNFNNLEKLNIVLSDRLNVSSTQSKNLKITVSIKKLILTSRSLNRIILDWSPFDSIQLEEFRKSIRLSGKQPPKLVFPLSSLNQYKNLPSNPSSCNIQ